MASSDVRRKLTVILVSDVVGYSRLMGDDPEGTLSTLTAYRKVFSDRIGEYKGRVVNAPGDSLLAEFTSVLDAISCAVDIQRELAERNQELPDNRRMDFRIGVTLGDVLVKEEALYGDGVNIAARLESLAEPGGICISGKAHTEVKNRLPLHFEFIGEQVVKNIAEPVKVYQVLSRPGAAAHRVVKAKRKLPTIWRRAVLAAVGMSALVIAALGGWLIYQQTGIALKKGTAPSLPDKPSIAVLPFTNMSGDPEQEYFSDGLTEDIITDLSKISGLLVAARTSSFTYKEKLVKVRKVGRELNVKYVLEGSVRKIGNLIRISAQFIDTADGKHLWAERYDTELKEIFALQDEIIQRIVTALKVHLTEDEIARVRLKTTDNMAAWKYYQKGQKLFRTLRSGEVQLARLEFEKAVRLDPKFDAALLGLGWTYVWENHYGTGCGAPSPQLLDRAAELARRAIAANDALAEPFALLGIVHLTKRQHDQAVSYARRAVALEPNGADWRMRLASNLSYAGNAAEALGEVERALALSPSPTDELLTVAARIQYQAGQYERAVWFAAGLRERNPNWVEPHLFLIASFSAGGRLEEARAAAADYFNLRESRRPDGTIGDSGPSTFRMRLKTYIVNYMRYRDQAEVDRLVVDLARAGVK